MTKDVLNEYFKTKNIEVNDEVIGGLVELENKYINKVSIEAKQKAESSLEQKLNEKLAASQQDFEKKLVEKSFEAKTISDNYNKQIADLSAKLQETENKANTVIGKNLILEKIGKVSDESFADILKLTSEKVGSDKWLKEVNVINEKYNIIKNPDENKQTAAQVQAQPVQQVNIPQASANPIPQSVSYDMQAVQKTNPAINILGKLYGKSK